MSFFGYSQDWFGLNRYQADNERIIASGDYPEVVFMGNSITEIWAIYHPEFFTSHNYCGRGIGGQTSSQMLGRHTPKLMTSSTSTITPLSPTRTSDSPSQSAKTAATPTPTPISPWKKWH